MHPAGDRSSHLILWLAGFCRGAGVGMNQDLPATSLPGRKKMGSVALSALLRRAGFVADPLWRAAAGSGRSARKCHAISGH
jgi:hypothetical protein